ncbi:hypothetical protein F4782DRAFT_524922 [Xylaria castorea]|nr:hypothetical protein F4782DRAFT_524922 [Xylaria castorea]
MQEVPATAQATTALVYWQAFAAEGTKIMTEEAALRARYEQLYPLRPLADARQPNPVRFYGPGPDGRVHPRDPPVGTLHFARWKRELEAVETPEDGGYYDGQNSLLGTKGQRNRPTYAIKGNQTAREVDYFFWEKVTVDSMRDVKIYPGSEATRATHDEYLLNEGDFNEKDDQKQNLIVDLNNRQDEDPKDIYPFGYQLLKKLSRTSGHGEWEEGQCLGPHPHSPNALAKHIGWFPKRLRMTKAGLGADPQDVVWNEVFHGNLDVKPKNKFVPPKARWSEHPEKVTIMTNSKQCRTMLQIVSREALKADLPLPEPDTVNARNAWLNARAPERSVFKVTKAVVPSELVINKSTVPPLSKIEVTADITSIKSSQDGKREELDARSTKEAEGVEIEEEKKSTGIELGANNEGEPGANRRMKTTTRDATSEERRAIEAKLKELSLNPEPGCESKRPIVIYSAFRSKFLGTPVAQILGYEVVENGDAVGLFTVTEIGLGYSED